METMIRKFPIGVQTFDKIIEDNYLYIDKTGYIDEIANKYKYVFLNRPLGFGKSLLSSTFHSYFEGRKDLFEGLKAGEVKKEWKRHPVFHFDMSTAKHLNEEQLVRTLEYKLEWYELIYGRGEKDINPNQRLEGLIHRAFKQTGQQAVIIIDEYDAPLLDVMNDKDKLPEYSALCGISQTELENNMQNEVQALADKQKVSYGDALALLKANYDGYHFCEESEDIYNPFSLIKSLNEKRFGSYWFDTGTPTYLIERLRKNPIDGTTLDNIPLVPQADFDVSPEISEHSLPMLYQTGYLTIKSYDERMQLYTLGYPNKEVKIGFTRGLLGEYPSKTGTASGFVAHFYAAMDSQDIDLAMEKLQAYLAGIPNGLENKTEKHYQTIIYLIFSLLGFYIRTEVKSAIGRADAVCYTDNCIYVFEFKVDGSAEDALKQIDDKGYMLPYKFEEGKNLVKVGVNISSQTRTVEKWIAR